MTDHDLGAALPYPPLPAGLELLVTGRPGAGGFFDLLHDGETVGRFPIGPVQLTLVAELINAARRAPAGSLEAFRRGLDLGRAMVRAGDWIDPEPESIARTIHRLRGHLNELPIAGDYAAEGRFGKLLVENQRRLGYRLGLPPERVRLVLFDCDED